MEEDILGSLKNCKEFADIVFKIEAHPTKQEASAETKETDNSKETDEGKTEEERDKEKGKEKEKEKEKDNGSEGSDARSGLLVDRHEDFRFLYAHKCILAARSDYFKVMFAAGMKESEFNLDFAAEIGGEENIEVPSPSFETSGEGEGEGKGKEKVEQVGEALSNKGISLGGLLAERSIPIEGVSYEGFVHILRFIYSGTIYYTVPSCLPIVLYLIPMPQIGTIKITPHTAMELLMASNQYRLSALKQLGM